MGRTTKLILDIVIGAVIPIMILNYLSEPLGAIPAYLLAALIPVAWVFLDLFFITRRFNVITSYTGLQAIMRGLLAFWFVDGWQFALKDTAGAIVATVVFAVSIAIGKPMMELFWRQGMAADTPEREANLDALIRRPDVRTALSWGTLILLLANILTGIANFWLNLVIVVAPFGTDLFNQQVAQVNAITRIALTIPELIAFGIAFWLLWRSIGAIFSGHEGPDSDDFWDALAAWRARNPQQEQA